MKKSIIFILLTVLILGIFTACNGDVLDDLLNGGSEPGPAPVEILYIDANTTTLTGGKTYTIAGDVPNAHRLSIDGTDPVTILLPAGKTLTVQQGITVTEGQTLIIDEDGTKGTEIGTLIAGGYGTTPAKTAGIGGVNESGKKNAGTITINGGIVYATGGTAAAGIGGGSSGVGGDISIEGGTVTAYGGENAAGIGGGSSGAGGNVTIKRGTVKAYGGANEGTGGAAGAGIGGGDGGNGGTVTITGGTVTAKGGSGDMEGGDGSGAGAGIGGGKNGAGGTVTINGGNVTAQGGDGSGVGIGGGHGSSSYGTLTIGENSTTPYTDGKLRIASGWALYYGESSASEFIGEGTYDSWSDYAKKYMNVTQP